MLRGKFLYIFASESVAYGLIILLAQAAVSFELVRVLSSIGGVKGNVEWLLVELMLLLLGDLVLTYAGALRLTTWAVESERRYLDIAFDNIELMPQLTTELAARDRFLAATVNPGTQLVTGVCNYIFQVARALLQTLSGVAAFSFVVNRNILWGFLAAAGICAYVTFHTFRLIARHNLTRATTQGRVGNTISLGWDNLTVGNSRNVQTWRRLLSRRFEAYRRRVHSSAYISNRSHLVMGVVAILLPVGVLGYLVVLKALPINEFLTLPKLLDTSRMLLAAAAYIGAAGTAFAHIQLIRKNISPVIAPDMADRVNLSMIAPIRATSIPQFLEALPQTGRITLSGPNGCGKSSLLAQLKASLRGESFFLPAKTELMFAGVSRLGSTGEAALASLQASLNGQEHFVLLDEWDANLDESNCRLGSRLIDLFVERGGLVIEVRHRRVGATNNDTA